MNAKSILKLPFYKDAAQYLSTDDRRELVRMLGLANITDPDSLQLAGLFNFASTPQGHDYWASLCHRLGRAGASCGDAEFAEWFNGQGRTR